MPSSDRSPAAAANLMRLRADTRKLITECRASVAAYKAAALNARETVLTMRARLDEAKAHASTHLRARGAPTDDSRVRDDDKR